MAGRPKRRARLAAQAAQAAAAPVVAEPPPAPPAPEPPPPTAPPSKPRRARLTGAEGIQVGSPSGAKKRAAAKAAPTAAGQPNLKLFDPAIRKALENLGPPPVSDPLALTEWHAGLTGICAWAYAVGKIGPAQHVRLKGMLEAVRSGGMVAVKAQERKRQRAIAERVGAAPTTEDDGLDEFPGTPPDVGPA